MKNCVAPVAQRKRGLSEATFRDWEVIKNNGLDACCVAWVVWSQKLPTKILVENKKIMRKEERLTLAKVRLA